MTDSQTTHLPTESVAQREDAATVHATPDTIGPYKILRLIGEGGMGVVYEAEQAHPRRVVALKVMKSGFASHEMVRRFELEANALARLQHPGIAHIYESGIAVIGSVAQPYFAMELIRGTSLTAYAEAHHLSTTQRLEIMIKVCEAVQHAHQRGLIHRDLKPGNILVDETGQPKILDFGVARAIEVDRQATLHTNLGQLVGTLAYMSPEQVSADPFALDARSDVYALGVVLYELLGRRLPYTLGRQLNEAVRTIREDDPTPLGSINRLYRGDVATIAAKALEKDKTRRYASAADLAADIRRYVDNEPIAARPPTSMYQLYKFSRRHTALVSSIAAVFLVLVAGTVVSTWQAIRASRAEQIANEQRDRANREAATARQVSDFLVGLFNVSDPSEARGNTLTAREILETGAAKIERDLAAQPDVQARIMATIGAVYQSLGMYTRAEPLQQQALTTARRVIGPDDAQTLKQTLDLANLYWFQERWAEAEPLYIDVIARRTRVLGPEHPDTSTARLELATLYGQQKRWAEGEQLLRALIDVARRSLGENHPTTLRAMSELSSQLYGQKRYAEAFPLEAKATEIRRATLGADHVDTVYGSHNLSTLYWRLGQHANAESSFATTIEAKRRVFGPAHPTTIVSIRRLSTMYQERQRFSDAERELKAAFDTLSKTERADPASTAAVIAQLADLYTSWGKSREAAEWRAKVPQPRK